MRRNCISAMSARFRERASADVGGELALHAPFAASIKSVRAETSEFQTIRSRLDFCRYEEIMRLAKQRRLSCMIR